MRSKDKRLIEDKINLLTLYLFSLPFALWYLSPNKGEHMLPLDEIPDDVFDFCYHDPKEREGVIKRLDKSLSLKLGDIKSEVEMEIEIEWSEMIKWIYKRLDDILIGLADNRKENLTPSQISQDKILQDIEEARVLSANLCTIGFENQIRRRP